MDDAPVPSCEACGEPEPCYCTMEPPELFPEPATENFSAGLPEGAPGWVIEGVLWRDEIAMIAAPSEQGKSWFTQELAVAVASGTPFAGHYKVPAAGKVLYIYQDSGPGTLEDRFKRLSAGREVGTNLVRRTDMGLKLDTAAGKAAFIQAVAQEKPAVVIFDSYRSTLSGRESSDTDAQGYFDAIMAAQAVHPFATVIVHHHRKQAGTAKEKLRGHGIILERPDVYFHARRLPMKKGSDEAPVVVRTEKDRDDRHFKAALFAITKKGFAWRMDQDPRMPSWDEQLEMLDVLGRFDSNGVTVASLMADSERDFKEDRLRYLLNAAVDLGLLEKKHVPTDPPAKKTYFISESGVRFVQNNGA
jgi:hypothetical protein